LLCIIGAKFLAALQFESPNQPEPMDKYTICCVPCFNEGIDSLRTCIDSITSSIYVEQRLLLFIVVDGVVTGYGNEKPTSQYVLDILSADPTRPPVCMYHSLGDGSLQLNFANVYSGTTSCKNGSVPYIVVIKIGDKKENRRPGNR
jgi:chitin synthase